MCLTRCNLTTGTLGQKAGKMRKVTAQGLLSSLSLQHFSIDVLNRLGAALCKLEASS
jgi:hypothetical protein